MLTPLLSLLSSFSSGVQRPADHHLQLRQSLILLQKKGRSLGVIGDDDLDVSLHTKRGEVAEELMEDKEKEQESQDRGQEKGKVAGCR
jgi:hypothetical protein